MSLEPDSRSVNKAEPRAPDCAVDLVFPSSRVSLPDARGPWRLPHGGSQGTEEGPSERCFPFSFPSTSPAP